MKRRTLDLIFAGGGTVFAVLLLVLGFVFTGQASFARDYVKDQLGQQKITFATDLTRGSPQSDQNSLVLEPRQWACMTAIRVSLRRHVS